MPFIEHGFIKALDEHTLLVSEDSIAQGYVAELVFIANETPRIFGSSDAHFVPILPILGY